MTRNRNLVRGSRHLLGFGGNLSVSGTTALTTLATVRIPAPLLIGGSLLLVHHKWAADALNGNTKAPIITLGGTQIFAASDTAMNGSIMCLNAVPLELYCINETSQIGPPLTAFGTSSGSAWKSYGIDLSIEQPLLFRVQLGNAADRVTLTSYRVEAILG